MKNSFCIPGQKCVKSIPMEYETNVGIKLVWIPKGLGFEGDEQYADQYFITRDLSEYEYLIPYCWFG